MFQNLINTKLFEKLFIIGENKFIDPLLLYKGNFFLLNKYNKYTYPFPCSNEEILFIIFSDKHISKSSVFFD